jgi:hypothetical protein
MSSAWQYRSEAFAEDLQCDYAAGDVDEDPAAVRLRQPRAPASTRARALWLAITGRPRSEPARAIGAHA